MKKALLFLCGIFYVGAAFGAGELVDLADYVDISPEWGVNIQFRALSGDIGTNSGDYPGGLGSHVGMGAGDWRVGWSDGTFVQGQSTCSTTSFVHDGSKRDLEDVGGILPADTFVAGQYDDTNAHICWCRMSAYSLAGAGSKPSDGAWVLYTDDVSAEYCSDNCALHCADSFQRDSITRRMIFGDSDISIRMILGDGGEFIRAISLVGTASIDLSNYCETNPDMCGPVTEDIDEDFDDWDEIL